MGEAATLSLMHVGAVVDDLEAAIEEHSAFGAGPWAVSDVLRFATYDGERRRVVDQQVRMAYGALPGSGAIELVEPGAATPDSPQRRLLAHGAGVTHLAYWCHSVEVAARPLLAAGATVFTASMPGSADAASIDVEDPAGILATANAAYLRLATGAIVELVSVAVARSLVTMLGPTIEAIVPVPDLGPGAPG